MGEHALTRRTVSQRKIQGVLVRIASRMGRGKLLVRLIKLIDRITD